MIISNPDKLGGRIKFFHVLLNFGFNNDTHSGLEAKSVSPLGQSSELVPLPGKGWIGRLKYSLVARLPEGLTQRVLLKTGSFLFAVAVKR